jgi:hypothetical protein
VWGRPVGDVVGWVRDIWLPKWLRQVANLDRVREVDTNLAGELMGRLKGPGAAARHWLQGLPPSTLTEPVLELLRAADDAWVDLWVSLAGHDPKHVIGAERHRVHNVIFGSGDDCLAHESAALVAPHVTTIGMSVAIDDLLRTAIKHKMDPRPWGEILDLPALTSAGNVTPGVVGECVRVLAERAKAAEPPAPSTKFNAWIAAFGDPGSLRHLVDDDSYHSTRDLSLAAARILGLPVWPAIAGRPTAIGPPTCRLCGATNTDWGRRYGSSDVDPTIAESAEVARSQPPRAELDNYGEHISVCGHLPLSASLTRRHNNLARFCVRLARECGIDAALHDLPIGGPGDPMLRPADWIEHRVDATCPGGLAVDLTIICGGADRLHQAESAKTHKYADLLRQNTTLGLQVAGLATSGAVNGGTMAMLARWSSRRAARFALQGQRPRNVLGEVHSTFARKFVAIMTYQCRAYWQATSTHERRHSRPFGRTCLRAEAPNLTRSRVDKILSDLTRESLDPAAALSCHRLANSATHPAGR